MSQSHLEDRARHARRMLAYRNFRDAVVRIEGGAVLIGGKNIDEIEHDLPDATGVTLIRKNDRLEIEA